MKRSLFRRALIGTFDRVNARTEWHRLPRWPAGFNLVAFRLVLRNENLHDTWTPGRLARRNGSEPLDPELEGVMD